MATSVPVPMARPRSAWARAAASLTPSPTMATTLPSACSRRDDVDLVLRAGPRRCTSVDADLGGDRAGDGRVVAGEQHRRQAERAAAARSASALVGLTASATTSTPAGRAVPADERRRSARRSRPRPAAAVELGGRSQRPVGEQATPGPTSDRRDRRPRPARRGPRCCAKPSTAGRAPTSSVARRWRSPGRSDARRRARARRPGAAPRRVGAVGGDHIDAASSCRWSRCRSCPARWCRPRRVDSSTSGPLIRMPSCAPRPVPTSSAVGVARPRAHGQAMISTATAAVNAAVPAGSRCRASSPSVATAMRDDDRHEDPGDPVGQALDVGLAGLRVLDQPGHLRQLGVGADPGGPDHEPTAGVDGRADDRVAGADLDRAPIHR